MTRAATFLAWIGGALRGDTTRRVRIAACSAGFVTLFGALALTLATTASIEPVPSRLGPSSGDVVRARIVDRYGRSISTTYDNRWNVHDVIALHEVPPLLRKAFVTAEDRRFFEHDGVDWLARGHAVIQNARAGSGARGASTITEQVLRLHRRRPRSVWARWLEGFEARTLEQHFSKGEILELYLNQVPYARRRRGVVQAARHYFDRDLGTLSPKEMLALAVLVRAPGALDLRRGTDRVERRIASLADRLHARGVLDDAQRERIETASLILHDSELPVDAPHFARLVRDRAAADDARAGRAVIRTTLDGTLQQQAAALLERRLARLRDRRVTDGAVLIVDHRRNEVLAWVNAGGFDADLPGSQIDVIVTPRQPGSTLKPFVYAAAMEQGWTAATLIEDAPLSVPVGHGSHAFRNYSRHYYGPLRVREALGNSLNVPAVRAVQFVTPTVMLGRLRELGFESLRGTADEYGDGLALGNGEVTLEELVAAYATLARGGVAAPIAELADGTALRGHGGLDGSSGRDQGDSYDDDRLGVRRAGRNGVRRRVISREIASIVADILSDGEARQLEFGRGGALDLPVPTAVKTGTSNDYRDAWAVGFSDRHTVGVWMGNLDRREMDGVSGAIGPALVLRGVFAELRRRGDDRGLPLDRSLRRAVVCARTGAAATGSCPTIEEWFRVERLPTGPCPVHSAAEEQTAARPVGSGQRAARLVQPTPGLHLAMDPRIPDELEAFRFQVALEGAPRRIEWIVDGKPVGRTTEETFAWPLTPGEHTARARVWAGGAAGSEPVETPMVRYVVKGTRRESARR